MESKSFTENQITLVYQVAVFQQNQFWSIRHRCQDLGKRPSLCHHCTYNVFFLCLSVFCLCCHILLLYFSFSVLLLFSFRLTIFCTCCLILILSFSLFVPCLLSVIFSLSLRFHSLCIVPDAVCFFIFFDSVSFLNALLSLF